MGKHSERPPMPKKVGCPPELHGKTTIYGGKKHGKIVHLCSRCGGQVSF